MFGSGHWEQKCLGEVGTFKRGGGFQKSDYVECGIPCIHYGQIHTKFGPFIYSHISEISSDLECKTKFASKGDLIIAITSEDTEGSCKSTAWLGDYPVAVGGHAAIFHHSMNPVYMSFFFKSVLFNHAKMEYIHGTKVCEIKPDDIAKILVPYPPMSLQEEFSSIAQQADKSKFVGFKSQFIEMFEGDKYPYVKLSDIASEWLKGQSFRKDDIVDNGNSMCIHYGELFTKYGPIINQVLSRTNVEGKRTSKVGDILFPASDVTPNGLARCSMLPYDNIILGGDIIVLRPKRDCNAAYLSYAINQQTAQLLIRVNGAVVKHLSAKALMTVVIPMPPLEEQNRFVSLAQQADKSKLVLLQIVKSLNYNIN